jgi:2'-5' RNA ligase
MVHWTENRAREHSHENFPPHDAKPVRAFVAIRMSAQVEDAVAAITEKFRRPRDGVRWVPRANLHITLKFLGPSVDPHRLERLTAGLHEVAMKTAPFEVAARGLGAFPNLEHPRAIWVGLHGVELGALAARVETAAAEHGFERENRRWSGHLTIGRVRDTQHLTAATREALGAAKETEFGVSKIESITLYRSHLGPEAASYEALATFLFHHR